MRMTPEGGVTIPPEVQEKAGFKPGDNLEFVFDGASGVRIVAEWKPRPKAQIQAAIAKLRGSAEIGMSTDELMRELRGWDDEPPGVLG